MDTVNQQITVIGMTCGNCVRHVKEALLEIDGVLEAAVSLESSSAAVRSQRTIEREEFARVLDEAGYTLA